MSYETKMKGINRSEKISYSSDDLAQIQKAILVGTVIQIFDKISSFNY